MRTVKQILGKKPKAFNTIHPKEKVLDALNQLNSVNLSYLVVMDGDIYKGLFSERDYSRNVILKGRASHSTTVSEVMTTDLPVVGVRDTVEHCMNLMNLNRTRYLLAFDDDDRFLGVITIHDLLREVLTNREEVFDSTSVQQFLDQDESGNIY